jgi:hypothetical protein
MTSIEERMKTKEEQARGYAMEKYPHLPDNPSNDEPAHGKNFLRDMERIAAKHGFLAGWDACNSAREKELPLNFWNRLASFISNVQVNDLPGLEEQGMIMHTCEKMLAKEETKQ